MLSNFYLMYLDHLFLNSFFTRKLDSVKAVNECYQDTIFNKIQRMSLIKTEEIEAHDASTLDSLDKESIGYHSMTASSSINSNLSTISEASVEPGQKKSLTPKRRIHSALRRKSLLLRVLDFNFLLLL